MQFKFSKSLGNVFIGLFLIIAAVSNTFAASAGDLDTSFWTNGTVTAPVGKNWNVIRAIAVQPDGKIVAGGYAFASENLQNPDFALARFNKDGSLDATFGSGGKVITPIRNFDDQIYSLAILPNGKIIAGGYSNRGVSGQFDPFDFALAQYNKDGSLDTSFGANGIVITAVGDFYSSARGIGIQPDGKIVVTGNGALACYHPNGALNTAFGNSGTLILSQLGSNSLVLQTNGKIIVGGRGGATFDDFTLARFFENGTPDTSFGVNGRASASFGGNAEIYSMAIQRDGKIVAAGGALSNTDYDFALARFNADGSPDNSFGTNGKTVTLFSNSRDLAYSIAIQRNGKILTAGNAYYNGSNEAFALARYNRDGSLDTSFGNGGKITTAVGLSSGANAVALLRNGRIIAGGASFVTGGNYNFTLVRYRNNPAIFDFDGDSTSDVSLFRVSNGGWHIQQSSGDFYGVQFGLAGDVPVPADFSGDNATDIAVWRPNDGNWYVFNPADNTFSAVAFGKAGDTPAPADYDGDGTADMAVFRPSNGAWYILKSSGGLIIEKFGLDGDKPVAADYDGDGKTDIAVFRPTTAEWWIQHSAGGWTVNRFGAAGDKPVQADYTGDGRADLAFWRASTGEWFVLRSENESFYSFPFGTNGDIPAPADYDGDSRADAGIFRPSSAVWYLLRSSSGLSIQSFGQTGDVPVPSAFVP